jgi:hypothetical protein
VISTRATYAGRFSEMVTRARGSASDVGARIAGEISRSVSATYGSA